MYAEKLRSLVGEKPKLKDIQALDVDRLGRALGKFAAANVAKFPSDLCWFGQAQQRRRKRCYKW